MSADNWSWCPRCAKTMQEAAEEKAKIAREVADEAYGNVSASDWREMDADALKLQEAIHSKPEEQTMREDWEIGVPEGSADGDLFISYRAACGECGLLFEFTHEATIE